jgi:sec-independent protein translocase protein TatA
VSASGAVRYDAVDLGWPELVIILAIVLLLFGATRLPKIARSIGQSGRELKDGFSEGKAGDADPAATKPAEPQVPKPDDA